MNNQVRRSLATLSVFGITNLKKQNPLMIAWWSMAFPGFGHYMLHQYIRATLFTLSEVITNTLSHVNEAIIYSFCGQFELAKSVIQPRWVYGYLAIFFYAIWDGYRSATIQNKMYRLAEFENEPIKSNLIHPLEIQYLESKSPYTAAVYSLFLPGLGQVYNHRFGLAFYVMLWWWLFITFSHAYEAAFCIFLGDFTQPVAMLESHWLLFMPSVMGGPCIMLLQPPLSRVSFLK